MIEWCRPSFMGFFRLNYNPGALRRLKLALPPDTSRVQFDSVDRNYV